LSPPPTVGRPQPASAPRTLRLPVELFPSTKTPDGVGG
jgi:hypothetical protein